MVYFGRVLRNNKFSENGRIDVLLGQRNFFGTKAKENDMKELKERVDSIPLILGKRKSGADSRAVRCLLVSSMANSPNAGMIQIPQVGSVGLVLEVVNDSDVWPNDVEYFWLGGLWGLTQYPGFIEKDAKISLPNDDTVDDELASSEVDNDKKLYTEPDSDAGNIKDSDYFKKGQFILKTKTCDIPDSNGASKIDYDYDKIPGENTFILNQDKCSLRHNIYEGDVGSKTQTGIEEIVFEPKRTKLLRRFKNDGEDFEQYIRFDKDGMEILNDNKKDGQTIDLKFKDNGDIILTTTHDNFDTIDGKSEITIKGEYSKVNIEGNSEVKIKGDSKVEIEGESSITSKKNMHITTKASLDINASNSCTINTPNATVNSSSVTIIGHTVINGHLEVT